MTSRGTGEGLKGGLPGRSRLRRPAHGKGAEWRSSPPFDVRAEVREALARGRAVVALETSVVAQGLPRPHGVEVARLCEAAVRAAGAVPATVGVAGGRVAVGMTAAQLERLADPTCTTAKAGERDLAPLCAAGGWGGTTVGATCAVASACGIRFVATGGIGGVHRTAPGKLDVSADLYALARFPVAVVCTGAKAVLDLPRTVEALESLAVMVLGFRTGEFPAFYVGASGLALEHQVDSPEETARVLRLRFEGFGGGGALVVQSPPGGGLGARAARAIRSAVSRGRAAGATGKDVTPFLLTEVNRATSGEARRVNVALLEANAALAGRIATAYARLSA